MKSSVGHFVIHISDKEDRIRGKTFRNVHGRESRIKRSEMTRHSPIFLVNYKADSLYNLSYGKEMLLRLLKFMSGKIS